jgi:hypothetical protein
MPMMEKIVHTAKHTVKAIVESQRARFWSSLRTSAGLCMVGIHPRFAGQPFNQCLWQAGGAPIDVGQPQGAGSIPLRFRLIRRTLL